MEPRLGLGIEFVVTVESSRFFLSFWFRIYLSQKPDLIRLGQPRHRDREEEEVDDGWQRCYVCRPTMALTDTL